MNKEQQRQAVEKILWEAYNPKLSPNMEEVSEEICRVFAPLPDKSTEGWRDDFRKQFFVHKLGGTHPDHVGAEKEAITFIEQLLVEIKEEVEEKRFTNMHGLPVDAFNQGLERAISIITSHIERE